MIKQSSLPSLSFHIRLRNNSQAATPSFLNNIQLSSYTERLLCYHSLLLQSCNMKHQAVRPQLRTIFRWIKSIMTSKGIEDVSNGQWNIQWFMWASNYLLCLKNHGYNKGIQKDKKESSFEADYYQSKEIIQLSPNC
jgi:hypothetical protein